MKTHSSWTARPTNIWSGFTTRQLRARVAAGCNGGEREEIERREQRKTNKKLEKAQS